MTSEQPTPHSPHQAIELEIFKHLFASIAEEMGGRLMRSAYSPNIKERRDFSCALFNHNAEMIAQAAHIPVHLGSTPMSVQAVMAAFPPDTMKASDRFILNDPFAGGTHLPDITVVAPCLLEGELTPRFFVANRAHHADVGGISPGSMPMSTHIDQEGLRISPQRFDEETLQWICEHSRTPEERRGDLQAQMAALQVGIERMKQLCLRYGNTQITEHATQLQAYTSRIIRQTIREIPEGRYTFEDVIEGDGFAHRDIAIRATITIQNETATVDLTDSDDQVPGPVNAVRAIALSATNYVFQCICPVDVPSNAGVMEPITLLTRPGSIVDALPPSAVAGGNVETSQRIVDVLLGALSKAIPHRIPAASCGSMNNLTIGGVDPRHQLPFAYYETIAGGAGAGPRAPGASAVHTHMTNTRNTPVEALEHAYPFRIELYRCRCDSAGAGTHPGGEGVHRRYAFDSPVEITLLTERRTSAPYGLHGGSPGKMGQNLLFSPDSTHPEELPAKCTLQLQKGHKLEMITPGGGGWNEPTTNTNALLSSQHQTSPSTEKPE